MADKPKPIPDGYHTVTPYLIVDWASRAIDFYKQAFGAVERLRIPGPNGRVGHAELAIGDSTIMIADEYPDMGIKGPKSIGGSPVSLHLYVENVDAVIERAVAAGGTLQRPIANQFYGDRMGSIIDPFGHVWHVSTHIEDVPDDELRRRAEAAAKGNGG